MIECSPFIYHYRLYYHLSEKVNVLFTQLCAEMYVNTMFINLHLNNISTLFYMFKIRMFNYGTFISKYNDYYYYINLHNCSTVLGSAAQTGTILMGNSKMSLIHLPVQLHFNEN